MQYRSVPFSEIKSLPAVSAVYFLIFDREIVYVGKSQNIRSRWRGHAQTVNAKAAEAAGKSVSVAWVEIEKEHLDETETAILRSSWPNNTFKYNGNYNISTVGMGELITASQCGTPMRNHSDQCKICARLDQLEAKKTHVINGVHMLERALRHLGYGDGEEKALGAYLWRGSEESVTEFIETHAPCIAKDIIPVIEKINRQIADIEIPAAKRKQELAQRIYVKSIDKEINLQDVINTLPAARD